MAAVNPTILHQAEVEAVIATKGLTQFAKRGVVVVASPTAPSATYVQAEAASMKTALDAIRAQLTAAGITA